MRLNKSVILLGVLGLATLGSVAASPALADNPYQDRRREEIRRAEEIRRDHDHRIAEIRRAEEIRREHERWEREHHGW